MNVMIQTLSCFLGIFLLCHDAYSLSQPSSSINRRDALLIGGGLGIGSLLKNDPAFAEEASSKPVAVLGASGRTGSLCVIACLERGIPVRALTRSGTWQAPEGTSASIINSNNSLLTVSACDVKDESALKSSIKGCRAVLYAASASKQGGNPKAIDNDGVVAAGDACIKANVSRYVVLSSTATTRPKSLGYIFTNVFGGIMDEKRKGEQGVMEEYSTSSSSGCSYTIVRPGGLEEPKENKVLGPSTLEISQGDTLTGIISRADLAQATVELALCEAPNVKNTSCELYYTESAQPCEGKFKSLLTSSEGVRLHGTTYKELFSDMQPNTDFYQP